MILSGAPLPSAFAIASLSYLLYVRCLRYRRYTRLEGVVCESLDLNTAHSIYREFSGLEFPFLMTKALEFGLFKTYAIPSISSLLVRTRELVDNVSRRYDDTDLIVRECTERPPGSFRADLSIQRLNFLHGQYPSITNEEYIYVLCVFIVEPVRWISKYGYRCVHPIEKESSYIIWKDIGIKMGIRDIPESFENAAQYMDQYEEKFMVYHPNNVILAKSTLSFFLSIVPSFFRPLGERIVHALCNERLRLALEYPTPPCWLVWVTNGSLYAASYFNRLLALPRRKALLRTPDYPETFDNEGKPIIHRACPMFNAYDENYRNGYRIDELGPERYVAGRSLRPLFHSQENL